MPVVVGSQFGSREIISNANVRKPTRHLPAIRREAASELPRPVDVRAVLDGHDADPAAIIVDPVDQPGSRCGGRCANPPAQGQGFREYLAGLLVPRDRNKTLTALAGAGTRLAFPWPAPQRWWQAWSKAPSPQLQALINSVAAGGGLHLYILN